MRALQAVLGILIAATVMDAATIIGTPATGANCFPFGCSGGTRYQQVYDAAGFDGPLSITGLTFYDPDNSSGSVSPRTFEIHLSTTLVAVDALSSTMDNNAGGIFSRMHDFGSAFEGYGLVTGFETGPYSGEVPEPAAAGLIGLGLALMAWRKSRQ